MTLASKPTLGFLNGDQQTRQRKSFTRSEKAAETALGGRRTAASGALGMKGDVWAGDAEAGQRVMLEDKSTQKKQITIKLAWLLKLVHEAFQAGMEPVLKFSFMGKQDLHWVAVPMDRYQELMEREALFLRGELDKLDD